MLMGRIFFAVILLIVGVMYVGMAYMATIASDDPLNQITGGVLFAVIGLVAAVAAFNLLRVKRR